MDASVHQMVVIFRETHQDADPVSLNSLSHTYTCRSPAVAVNGYIPSSVLLQRVLIPLRFDIYGNRRWQVVFFAAQRVYTLTSSCDLSNMLTPPSSSGDVIVYINDICVLGTTHADVVKLFQSVPIGQSVTLMLCRGYPLPFDPEDPSGAASTSLTPIGLEHRPLVVNGRGSYDPYLEYLSLSSQLPPQALAQAGAPHPGDTHLDGSSLPPTTPGSASALTPHDDNVSMASSGTAGVAGATAQGAELLTVTMVKGTEGFGFTIADSPTGQRVKQVMYHYHACISSFP